MYTSDILNTHYINTDMAIKTPAEDQLGRSMYAEYIAKALSNAPKNISLTFSLEGKWGTGKTSLINMIIYYLKNQDNVIVVKFSAWLIYQNKGDLIQQFLKTLECAISSKKIDNTLKKYGEALFKSKLVGRVSLQVGLGHP